MPIRIDLHDNTSQVKVRPRGKDQVNVESGCEIDKKRFEALLDEEIKNRILGDKELSDRIDDLEDSYIKYLDIDELEDGRINISLLNDKGEVVDTKTITLTEKIIKSAEFDEENKKLIYTCNDDSVIEIDISSIVDDIADIYNEITQIKSNITNIQGDISILDTRVGNAELTLSTITNQSGTGTLDIITNTTIPSIQNDISIIQSGISDINLTLSDITNDQGTGRLDVLEPVVADAIVELSILQETKVDINFNLDEEDPAKRYARLIPKDLTPEQTREMLIYINNNGIPSYAKLNELGYARIRDIEDIDKVDNGDILIDMD